jgi:hypothetical protein
MKKLFPLFFVSHFLACVSSCSYFQRDNKAEDSAPNEALAAKKAFYCEQGKRVLAERGFMDDRCDSLLFTSLFATACGGVDLSAWEDPALPGKWHRNPERDCYLPETGPNGSASSISRDMFLGLFHQLWKTKDLANTSEIVKYGENNKWVMGEAKDDETLVSRCLFTPQLISLVYDLETAIKGRKLTNDPSSADAGPLNTGFRAHLDILRIHLSGLIRGGLTDSELATVEAQASRQPRNALFAALAAKYGKRSPEQAYAILLDESLYPASHLPTNGNRCINYLNSRDQDGADWLPCPEEGLKEHDGTDFVFAASILDGTF